MDGSLVHYVLAWLVKLTSDEFSEFLKSVFWITA
jgi:hypothetical protein